MLLGLAILLVFLAGGLIGGVVGFALGRDEGAFAVQSAYSSALAREIENAAAASPQAIGAEVV